MPDRFSYNLLGIIFSLVVYIGAISGVTFYLQERVVKKINYTSAKKSLLNVTLVEKKSKIHKKKRPKKRPKKAKKTRINKSPKVKKSTKKTAKKSLSLQKLFDKIDTKDIKEPTQKKVKLSRKKRVVKTEKSKEIKKATQLVDNLELENQQLMNSAKEGIYDEYKGKIQEIIDKKWQTTISTVSGAKATVVIYIDKFGRFSYKIVKLSYNDAFNAKLMDFLENMQEEEFPPSPSGDIFKLQILFKDELE